MVLVALAVEALEIDLRGFFLAGVDEGRRCCCCCGWVDASFNFNDDPASFELAAAAATVLADAGDCSTGWAGGLAAMSGEDDVASAGG